MSDANQTLAEGLVCAFLELGLEHAVISPGSRNTPLILALHAQRHQIQLHRVLDERSAAFFALGLARISGKPALLCCTSGSAGAHYYPAVVEASRSATPLIVLTADRPPELHGVGAPQTLQQHQLYGPHVRACFNAQAGPASLHTRWIQTLAARAWQAAAAGYSGPVHLNVAFRKPLWTHSTPSARRPVPRVHQAVAALDEPRLNHLLAGLRSAKRGVIIVGTRHSVAPDFSDAVHALAEALGWPILAEATSGARFGADRANLIHLAELLLSEPGFAQAHRPDRVLCLGQVPTNRAVAEWAQSVNTGCALLVNEHGCFNDPLHVCSELYVAQPAALCRALADRLSPPPPSPWLQSWRGADRLVASTLAARKDDGLWEGAIAQTVVAQLPADALLHLASSMPVRDVNTYATGRSRPLRIASNRGLNGIDGLISAALGEATCWSGPAFLLIGDLSFLHDLSALHLARQLKTALTIVLIDNGGGGIFSELPIVQHTEVFEPYFQFKQEADVRAICGAFQVGYREISDRVALKDALTEATAGPRLLHLVVEHTHNQGRRAAVKAAVSQALRERSA